MAERYYTETHEWVSVDGNVATIGITDFAQAQLGDVGVAEDAGEQVDHLLLGGGKAGPVPLGGLGVVGDRGGHEQPPPLGRAVGAGHRRLAAIAAPVRGSVR